MNTFSVWDTVVILSFYICVEKFPNHIIAREIIYGFFATSHNIVKLKDYIVIL